MHGKRRDSWRKAIHRIQSSSESDGQLINVTNLKFSFLIKPGVSTKKKLYTDQTGSLLSNRGNNFTLSTVFVSSKTSTNF